MRVILCLCVINREVGGKLDYSPVSWREYFDNMEDVNVGQSDSRDVFRVYKAGSEGPLLVLLHGGGHSALSWAVFTVSVASLHFCAITSGTQMFNFCFCSVDSHCQQSEVQGPCHGPQGTWWVFTGEVHLHFTLCLQPFLWNDKVFDLCEGDTLVCQTDDFSTQTMSR